MRIIDKNKITKVAVSEQVVGGYYPFIYILRESKYEVKTIDMKYGSIHEDQKFEPEAVMLIHDGPNAPDIYERNGKQYYRCSNEYKLLFNNAYAALYIDEELLNLKEDCQPSFDKSLNGGCRPA